MRAEGKYIQWKTRLTFLKLTFRNRWQSGVLEKTMKSTCPSNELFLYNDHQDASGDSVVGDFPFVFIADPLAGH